MSYEYDDRLSDEIADKLSDDVDRMDLMQLYAQESDVVDRFNDWRVNGDFWSAFQVWTGEGGEGQKDFEEWAIEYLSETLTAGREYEPEDYWED